MKPSRSEYLQGPKKKFLSICKDIGFRTKLKCDFEELRQALRWYRTRRIKYNKVNEEIIDLDFVYDARSMDTVLMFNAIVFCDPNDPSYCVLEARVICKKYWFQVIFSILILGTIAGVMSYNLAPDLLIPAELVALFLAFFITRFIATQRLRDSMRRLRKDLEALVSGAN